MFEDFDRKASAQEGRGRMGVSMLISGVIFSLIIAGLGAAIATARAVVRKQQRDLEVSFAELPSVPKPKPMVARRAAAPRKAVKRPMTAVKEIPQERPQEAEGELAIADDAGPVDGVIEQKAPPPVPPPPPPPKPAPEPAPPAPPEQEQETVQAPVLVSGCRAPAVPDALLSTAATIRIDVLMMIDAQGKVTSARVTQSHPLVPDDVVLRCAREQVFKPAHLPDGTAVPYPHRGRFTFRPAQA